MTMRKRLAALAALALLSGCAGTDAAPGPVKGKPIDPAAQAQANFVAEFEGLKSQVQRLNAEVEDLNLQIRTLTDGDGSGGGGATLPELSKRIAKVEGNLKMMGSQLGVEVDGQQPAAGQQPGQGQAPGQPPAVQQPGPQAQAQPPARTDVAPASGADPAEALYTKGMQSFQAKDYDRAIGLWHDVAKTYSKHALAPNAYFWLGEAYFQKNDWTQAVLNYNEVVEKFPKSNKTPSAMLKMGMAFQKLNKKDAARLMFQDLIKKFPDSAEARRAKTLL
ncbi:Cell division coordinator CpoB [Fundidesulfovibrio magnetotacticus]|uniref:Cell division coordinator CpoB n=1 Tax=Fundidesulfovibrio magnetotacticus TaxID=2730080 RepID=A0A6V8LWR2_9BACT|nr:tol-pal system protein YbgF [Fundidesulfovibrio magnetotacticus]GFK94236.1 Cell division coordinator CpoB [Fundidesulfovibrio magnetotacticus]